MFNDLQNKNSLPEYYLQDYKILLKKGCKPPFVPLRKYSKKEMKLQKEYINRALSKGWIKELYSPAGTITLFVKKIKKLSRFCVDYRKLNNITVKNRYLLPRADNI
jgi:hypothetical protein